VGVLKKLIFYSERICQAGNTLATFIGLYQTFAAVSAEVDAALSLTPAGPAAKSTNYMTSLSAENIREAGKKSYPELFNKYCNFVNCRTVISENDKGSDKEVDFSFGGVEAVMDKWQEGGKSLLGKLDVGNVVSDYIGKGGNKADPTRFLNPKDSLVVATLTGCVPGIIYGLDKARQVQCMYADCLQTGVGEQGLPVFACEDQKSYATCKYIVSEVFKVIPITAAFDYYANLVKSTLANPFKILGAGISVACNPGLVFAEPFSYGACAGIKVIEFIGITVQDVTSIFDSNTWTIQEDFCERLDKGGDSDGEDSGGLFGLF